MLEIKKQVVKKITNNLFILFACQAGKKIEAESKLSEMVYQAFMNQLNEK
jgi:hypothetical protein